MSVGFVADTTVLVCACFRFVLHGYISMLGVLNRIVVCVKKTKSFT